MKTGITLRWRELLPEDRWAPLWECGLLLVIGAGAWAAREPWLFTSLGPTAYEQVEKSNSPSARTYNILVGHYVALGAGLISLHLIGAWNSPTITGTSSVSLQRLLASVLAAAITTFVNLALRSGQPAALATALLVTSGAYQDIRGTESILIGVAMVAVLGEPVRRARLSSRHRQQEQQVQGKL